MAYEKKNYSEKLKDPRWQKKRLEIMSRDDFKCKWCFNDEKTLNVHHLKYHGDPWETPNDMLITLCEDCHQEDHEHRKGVEQELIDALKLKGFSYDNIFSLIVSIKRLPNEVTPWLLSEGLLNIVLTPNACEKIMRDTLFNK